MNRPGPRKWVHAAVIDVAPHTRIEVGVRFTKSTIRQQAILKTFPGRDRSKTVRALCHAVSA